MPGEPTPSGKFDALLGGHTNVADDREAARRITARWPLMPELAQAGHDFALHTVRRAAGEQGIRRFIRAGFVTRLNRNAHDVARAVAPDSRMVYVTRGDQALMALELLADGHVAVARARVANPADVLAAEPVDQMLAEGEPVCLVTGMLMQFAPPDGARDYLREFAAALPAGSVLAGSLIAVGDEETALELGGLFGLDIFTHTAQEAAGWVDGAEVTALTPDIRVPGTALGVTARIG